MDSDEAENVASDYRSGRSISWLKSEYSRGYQAIVSALDEKGVDRRSQKEQCNTEGFRRRAHERQEGTELSEDHKQAISEGVKKSDSDQAYWEGKSRKGVSDEDVLEAYEQADENAREASEQLDISARHTLNRLRQMGVDTSADEAWNKGQELTEEHRSKLSKAKKGKTWTEIFGEEEAQRRFDSLEYKDGFSPYYNPCACEAIENFADKRVYDFQHAENGGEYYISELGYFVDGYDEDQNVVVEYDEEHHFDNGELIQEDASRMREIGLHLECEFYRISADDGVYMHNNYKSE